MTNQLINPSSNTILHVDLADSFFKRFLGYMGRKSIQPEQGLLFTLARASKMDASIHMFFMRFDIAVIWLSEDFTVVDKTIARRWRPVYAPAQPARYILETHPAQIDNFSLQDRVELIHAS
jgi:uncharacterized protein